MGERIGSDTPIILILIPFKNKQYYDIPKQGDITKKKYMINQEDVEKVQAKMMEVKDVKSYKKLEIIALSSEGLTDAENKDSNIEFVRNVRATPHNHSFPTFIKNRPTKNSKSSSIHQGLT